MADTANLSPSQSLAFDIAQKTLPLMAKQHVDPIPPNYAVWFEFALGRNRALVKEMQQLIEEGVPFDPERNNALYHRFIAGADQAQAAHATATSAKALLTQIQKMMGEFGGRTESYNQELDKAVETMSADFSDVPELQAMVKEIVNSAVSLRQSGQEMTQELAASQAEIEQLRVSLATITTESQKDHLTGLSNRKALDRTLEELTQAAAQGSGELSLLMLDIDHFKQFNDKFGHLIGDEVLKIVARSLTDTVRGKDTVARYGGEEFAVLLPQTPVGGAMIVAESIRKTIASRDLKRKDTGESYGTITVSIGVANFQGTSDTVAAFVKRADDALYRSKKSGRNRVTQESLG